MPMILSKEELLKISGGEVSASLINAIARGISVFLDLGRTIGAAIRRATSGKTCSL